MYGGKITTILAEGHGMRMEALKQSNGATIYINPDLVRALLPQGDTTMIIFAKDHAIEVAEKADEIMKLFDRM